MLAVLALALALPVSAPAADALADLACDVPVASLALAPAASAGAACGGIRPGAHMDAPSGCTYNFVFRDAAGALYIGTAGHCVNAVGERVSATGVGEFGTVVFVVNAGVGADFGLIRIDAARYGDVSPAMCAWGGPAAEDPASVSLGDALKQFGHGLVLGQNEVTRAREGAVVVWDPAYWRAALPVTGGDSGSPVIFADGRAAGVVTHLSVSFSSGEPASVASTSSGTRLAHAIDLAENATGLELTLVTAPLAQ